MRHAIPLESSRHPGAPRARRGSMALAPMLGAALLLSGCREEQPVAPLTSLAPAPLPSAATQRPEDEGSAVAVRGAIAIAPIGEKVPASARRLVLQEGRIDGSAPELAVRDLPRGARVLLVPDASTFLVQVSPLLAKLDDAGAEVWLAHPEGPYAHRLTLRDEPAFQTWLDRPQPGRLRVIHRADGFELSTSIGKLPGPDANGPSIPLRGGVQDLGRLRAGLEALAVRFESADELCWVPSFGTELAQVGAALSAAYEADGEARFETLCLVYPRPKAPAPAAP